MSFRFFLPSIILPALHVATLYLTNHASCHTLWHSGFFPPKLFLVMGHFMLPPLHLTQNVRWIVVSNWDCTLVCTTIVVTTFDHIHIISHADFCAKQIVVKNGFYSMHLTKASKELDMHSDPVGSSSAGSFWSGYKFLFCVCHCNPSLFKYCSNFGGCHYA